ncbi:cytidine deaminase-like protein [Lipomyces japonicus]|uniref:cytidine deaminase-like protein n=1 Tax=Lipomyces japonicus TaxID=56871 RepID=UPI0034CFA073
MTPSVGSPTASRAVVSEVDLHHKPPHNHHHRRRSSATATSASTALQTAAAAPKFVQVKSKHEHTELEFVEVWATTIPAKVATSVVSHVKQHLPKDPHSLLHLRRLVKRDLDAGSTDEIFLNMLICSVDAVPDVNDILSILQPLRALASEAALNISLIPRIQQVPRYPALTKLQSQEWSKGTWPIMWRGNPHAIITHLPADEEALLKRFLDKLVDLSRTAGVNGHVPIATMIIDPATFEIVASATDERTESGNPLFHSTMTCVAKVAEKEFQRRALQKQSLGPNQELPQQSYLCHNLQLVTTHEPCSMCSMAMVHSRISRLVYVKSMPQTGGIESGSGSGYGIHWNKQLNWRFEAWKWQGDDLGLVDVGDDVNA